MSEHSLSEEFALSWDIRITIQSNSKLSQISPKHNTTAMFTNNMPVVLIQFTAAYLLAKLLKYSLNKLNLILTVCRFVSEAVL
jgi:hypothetical protein